MLTPPVERWDHEHYVSMTNRHVIELINLGACSGCYDLIVSKRPIDFEDDTADEWEELGIMETSYRTNDCAMDDMDHIKSLFEKFWQAWKRGLLK